VKRGEKTKRFMGGKKHVGLPGFEFYNSTYVRMTGWLVGWLVGSCNYCIA